MNVKFIFNLLLMVMIGVATGDFAQAQRLGTFQHPDSVDVAASDQYAKSNLVDRLFLGKNYRKTWSTKVRLPVFHLGSSGFTITDLGGGMQTKSLRLKDKGGTTWVLRTIDKDPVNAVPAKIRNAFTVSVVQQIISAAYPYAPVTIAQLAAKAGIVATNPTIYWVPDDKQFGQYRRHFAKKVCLLERKDVTSEPIEVKGTDKVLAQLVKSNTNSIDQRIYLKARLLDMLIGDWDRHADQWAWAERKKGRLTQYEALPKDRDQAFFYSKGLLVRLVAAIKLKHLVGFTKSTHNLRKLNHKSWAMDGLFLNELTLLDWQALLRAFHVDLTDEVIAYAVKELPTNVYKQDGQALTAKLISRRDGLLKDVLHYYCFINKSVGIYGSADAELFEISGDKGVVTVTMRNKADKRLLYQRKFHREETKKITIYGLGGNDDFRCTDGNRSGISITINDAQNDDHYVATRCKGITYKNNQLTADAANRKLLKELKIKD